MPPRNLNWVRGKSLDLFIESYSNSARTVQIRGFSENEQIIASHTTNADRSLATSAHKLTETPLHITLRTLETGVKRGECYVKVSLRAEGVIVALLGSGYVTDTSTVVWPGGLNESSIEGHGLIRSITGTNPPAGVEISETVPTGVRWRLIAIFHTLVTNATAATRQSVWEITNGTNTQLRVNAGQNITANDIISFTVGDFGVKDTSASNANQGMIGGGLYLNAGFIIKTISQSLQAGDNYSAPQMLVEEWIEP